MPPHQEPLCSHIIHPILMKVIPQERLEEHPQIFTNMHLDKDSSLEITHWSDTYGMEICSILPKHTVNTLKSLQHI